MRRSAPSPHNVADKFFCGLMQRRSFNEEAEWRAGQATIFKMGELTPLETYSVGQRPMWVLTTRLGD